MARPLKPEARQDLEQEAWRLRRRGMTTYRIAEELAKPIEDGGIGLSVDRSSVTRALQRVADRLYAEFAADAYAVKIRHTELLEYFIEEALDAWERSKEDGVTERIVTKKTRRIPGIAVISKTENSEADPETDSGEALMVTEETVTKESRRQTGDPRYLEQVRAALHDIRAIWGIDAPKKTDLVSSDDKFPVLSYRIVLPSNNANEAPLSPSA